MFPVVMWVLWWANTCQVKVDCMKDPGIICHWQVTNVLMSFNPLGEHGGGGEEEKGIMVP